MHTVLTGPLVWCLQARRDGAPVPVWQQRQRHWIRGQLEVVEERQGSLGRHALTARLLDGHGKALLPPLIDARLLQVRAARMVLAGLERDELTQRDLAQTWVLISEPDEPRGAAELPHAS